MSRCHRDSQVTRGNRWPFGLRNCQQQSWVGGRFIRSVGSQSIPAWYMAGNITYNTTNRNEWHRTLKAIQTIGTNGLPYIMEKFTREDNRLEQWLGKAASAIGIRLSVSNPQQERRQAFTALLANSPLPPDVVATLKALSSSANQDISSKAKFVLSKTTGDHIVRLE